MFFLTEQDPDDVVPSYVFHTVMTRIPQPGAQFPVVPQGFHGTAQFLSLQGWEDTPVGRVLHELQRTTGIDSGDHRLAGEEGLECYISVVLAPRGEVDG